MNSPTFATGPSETTWASTVANRAKWSLLTSGGEVGAPQNQISCRESYAAAASRCWASTLVTTFPSHSTCNAWRRPALRHYTRCVCCAIMVWATRLYSASIVPPSSLVWHTPPARGAVSQRRPTDSGSTPWSTAPDASDTARRISRRSTNSVTRRMKNYSAKLDDWRITFYAHYYRHHPLHHNAITSDTAPTHYSCSNTPLTYQTRTFSFACCIKTLISLQTVHSILFYFTILNARVRFDMPY